MQKNTGPLSQSRVRLESISVKYELTILFVMIRLSYLKLLLPD